MTITNATIKPLGLSLKNPREMLIDDLKKWSENEEKINSDHNSINHLKYALVDAFDRSSNEIDLSKVKVASFPSTNIVFRWVTKVNRIKCYFNQENFFRTFPNLDDQFPNSVSPIKKVICG